MLASFRALRLNMGTDDVLQSTLLDAGTWKRIVGDAPREGRYVLGIDLGQSEAMSAAAAYWPASGRLEALASFPTVPSLTERGSQNGVGGFYQHIAMRAELVTTGGEAVNIGEFLELVRERFGLPSAIAADRWGAAELRDILERLRFSVCPIFERDMDFKDGAADVRDFRRAVMGGRVVPAPRLLSTAAMSEARTMGDQTGNAKLAISAQGGRWRRARGDAAAAAIRAVKIGS